MLKINRTLMGFPVALALFAGAATASAQSAAPIVGIQLLTSGLTSPIVANTDDATVARLVLDTSGSAEAVRISSIPFILSTGNGAIASTLRNCRVVNEANDDVNLSTPAGDSVGLTSGLNSITLSSPLTLAAGTVTTLDLMCDASAGIVSGGTFTFSMNTANVAGTGVTTGLPAIVTIRGAAPVTPVPPVVVIPTVPNTGAGGEAAQNVALLLGSVALAAVGVAYTRKASAQVR
jgi:hypothetical protein